MRFRRQNRMILMKFFAIFGAFFLALIFTSYLWILNNYNSDISLEVVLFHLRFPLIGANSYFVWSYTLKCIAPSVVFAIFFALSSRIALLFALILSAILWRFNSEIKAIIPVAYVQDNTLFEMLEIYLKGRYFQSFLWQDSFGFAYFAKLVLLIISIFSCVAIVCAFLKWLVRLRAKYLNFALFLVILALNFIVIDSHFDLKKLLKPKEYGHFYEENYTFDFSKKVSNRNLIIIFVESLESNFALHNAPNLVKFAKEHTHFSHTSDFGGIFQIGATSWTIAGMVGYLCGIPLNMPSTLISNNFLPSAICVSDILANSHNQVMLMGSDDDFVGKGAFLRTHKVISKDIKYFKENGRLKRDYRVGWGFEDSKLFHFAREEFSRLNALKSPFALYLLTNNTHYPDFTQEAHCGDSYDDAIKCIDSEISSFIKWALAQNSNTTIIILGDHYIHANTPNKRLFNAFINANFSEKSRLGGGAQKNRALSHFDIAPLILDSLGIATEAFGLGRNPFLNKTLLEIHGTDLNALVSQDSRLYEAFWELKDEK